jgi:MATE family multidrug resistance protein
MGFVGAPLAVAVTDNLLPIGLFLYVRFVNGRQCWNGFTKRSFQNWGPMIRLALPGLIMVEAEVLAFEILTFAAAYFGITNLPDSIPTLHRGIDSYCQPDRSDSLRRR